MLEGKPKIIAIVGPTGSGKTALAVRLARMVSGELVSADSRQVYRGMDIGTGKEMALDIPHHLIDVVSPDEDFTLADFLDRAKRVIADIHARGRVPIVVGGTGLYVQALVENWDIPAVKPDPALRAELEKKSVAELQKELAAIDTEEAGRLGAGKRYLIRALEMWHATGRKPSALKKKNEPLYDALMIGIDIPRAELYARIDARVDGMFARGLVDEVRGLLKKYPADLPAFRTIGYKEIINQIVAAEGHPVLSSVSEPERAWSPARPDERGRDTTSARLAGASDSCLRETGDPSRTIKHHTHAYARRQLTWLRRMKYVEWVTKMEDALEKVRGFGV